MTCLVSLVESWEDLEEYANWCRHGAYQLRETVDGVEIRVVVGRYGYLKNFKDLQDPALKRILGFCRTEGFVKVLGSVPDELFFASHKETVSSADRAQ